ncbi:hypothetical protein DASC09_052120 [Saccharomycopsis crataegensis]|uniref:Uncharacterized protein n=1 Tax=Saccharomycopsis crataegensis TaxID=43959 RepID=A0AAV5QSN1_9ASCO|nr:hypothetical protein DASC09_052120 [Saccharomycopsis crataegensis]
MTQQIQVEKDMRMPQLKKGKRYQTLKNEMKKLSPMNFLGIVVMHMICFHDKDKPNEQSKGI